ncbi:sll0787 family AIR synthase-like protein [Acetobacter ghanensis]|uniref:AIR synthase related protein n=1 Tax=Acetobacter ghanensis TaxID=431306 RepID=A0A0U5F4Q1_9PROT|nr:sll0787 family AIR synthase-like protein [Acetobacter ghanensis]NHO40168.1 sll0787 family AIR synthase-like protein [Acetobacter ghanensis]GBQ51494.1 selenophosphate synthetase [Acetobacter ghanensis DSM 18895]CEF56446.1 AIR synthase related protein [Acetobacter ghanensis]
MARALNHMLHSLRTGRALAAKQDIAQVAAIFGQNATKVMRLGDDCAAIPDGDGYLLLASEGFQDSFVRAMPWFAGYCGVMVNVSDIAAMGGRPVAVVDALWSDTYEAAASILTGLHEGARTYGVPVVGGHTNMRSTHNSLSVAILGRARHLLTSFDAQPGEVLIAAIDLRGRWHDPHPFWDASSALCGTEAAVRLRGDLELLPCIAEDGLSRAAKDISMAGLLGTALMLAECSGVGMTITLDDIPRPAEAPMERWLSAFPSYGYLLTTRPEDAEAVMARFHGRGIAAAVIGQCNSTRRVDVASADERETFWDLASAPLMGVTP